MGGVRRQGLDAVLWVLGGPAVWSSERQSPVIHRKSSGHHVNDKDKNVRQRNAS